MKNGVVQQVPWDDFGSLRVNIALNDGSALVVGWWVIKALFLPDKPADEVLKAMSNKERQGPWRVLMTPATPQVPTVRFPHRRPGVDVTRKGFVVGYTHFC